MQSSAVAASRARLYERVAQLVDDAAAVVQLRVAFHVQALLRGRGGRYVHGQQLEEVVALVTPRHGP